VTAGVTTHESSSPGPRAPAAAGARPARRRRRKRHQWSGLLLVAPLVVLLLVFVGLPLGRVVWYSLTDYDGFTGPTWTGLDNYRFLWGWGDFHRVLLNNVLLVAGIVVWIVVPFVISVLIYASRYASLIRTLLFLPALLPPIVVGGVFRLLLAEDGPVNASLRAVHLGFLAQSWLTDEHVVLVSVVLTILWAVMGSGVLFYSSGLSAISHSYIEAALVDGARWWQLVWHIYRPALRPVTQFWALLLTVATVTAFFPWIYSLTQGGPGISSTTLDYLVYRNGIQSGQLGIASAVAVVGVLLIAILLLVQLGARRVRATGDWT
jgi:ABC-type sugar transport system permease subunit